MKIWPFFVKRCFLLSIMSSVLNSCIAHQENYANLFKSSKRLDSPYAICSHINRKGDFWEYDSRDRDVDMIMKVGAMMIRTDFDWNSCQEKYEGDFRYAFLDTMMASVNQSRMNILGVLSPNRSNKDLVSWETYVSNTVKHYKERICYWEVMNEVDRIHTFQPEYKITDYPCILANAYRTIKKANPNATVLYTGASSIENGFVEMTFKENVKDYFDIMNMHVYTSKNTKPENLLSFYKRLFLLMQKYKISKPLWITETGCSTAAGGLSEEMQTEYLPRIFLISFACGVNKVFWYKSRSNELEKDNKECFFGLWHKDYTPKPAFYAYKTLTSMCPDKSTRPKLHREGCIYMASWKRPDGKKVWTLWTKDSEELISFDIKGSYSCYDIRGEMINHARNEIVITPSVIYIVGAKECKLISNNKVK